MIIRRLALFLLCATMMPHTGAAVDIVFVHQMRGQEGEGTGEIPDAGAGTLEWEDDQWRVLLEGAGHNIIDHGPYDDLDLDPSGLDVLNSADLVIFSRDSNSGDYNEPDEQEAWTEGVTVPMIIMTPFTIRSNRWDMVEATGIQEVNPPDFVESLQALDTSHPIFAGVLDDNGEAIVWDEDAPFLGPDDFELDSIDFINAFDEDGLLGNGTVLAIESGFEVPWIVYWEAGEEFYDGSTYEAGGPRLHYSVGSDDDPYSWGEKNTTAAGDQILLNAISWLAGGDLDGDFDGDGELDLDDVNFLLANLGSAEVDLNGDGVGDGADTVFWIKELKQTWIGDANLDGEFNSADLVSVFTEGKFETEQPAEWNSGDWNSDGRFDSGDFVAAFTDGGFEMGPRAATQTVPEPAGAGLLGVALILLSRERRR